MITTTRQVFIDRGRIVKFVKELGIEFRATPSWWERYQKTKEMSCKLSEKIPGRKSFFTFIHQEYIRNLLDKGPQLYMKIQ